jgi:hypothetical protein
MPVRLDRRSSYDKLVSMGLKLQLSRILGAAILLIALSFMPSVANAHGGHDHGSQPAASTPHHSEGVAASGQIADEAGQAELSQAESPSTSPSKTAGCNSGCCTGAACGACVGMAFMGVPVLAPPVSASSMVLLDASPSSSLPPEGLRKPPKSFA